MTGDQVAILVVTAGPLAGRRLELESELVIGRESAGLTIDDPQLSRRHAALRLSERRLEIEDLGSLNGTFVNGARIESATTLAATDVISVGRTSIQVEATPAASDKTVLAEREPTAAPTVGQAPAVDAPPPAPAPAPRAVPSLRPPADRPAQDVPPAAFGAFAPAPPRRRRSTATRRLTPTLLSFSAIVATAVALVIYFAQH